MLRLRNRNTDEGKTLYFAGRMYRLQPVDDKEDDDDEDDSDDEEEVARLKQQIAGLEKQLAEKTALATNQESLIVNLQRQIAGSRTVTDHEPRFALEQALAENLALRERLGKPPPPVPDEELRRAVSILTGANSSSQSTLTLTSLYKQNATAHSRPTQRSPTRRDAR